MGKQGLETEKQTLPHASSSVIVPVQWLRGMAACLVVIVHLVDRLAKRGAFPQELPDWVSSFGQIGVGTFFAISGFIMVYTTAEEFGRPEAGARFLLRRFLRIAPIYYLTTLLMIGFSHATFRFSTNAAPPVETLSGVVMSLLFIPCVDGRGIIQPVYALGWTLNYEMFFYLIFALAITTRRRIGLPVAMALLAGLVLAGMFMVMPTSAVGEPALLFFFTRPVLLYFLAGMVIGWLRLTYGALSLRRGQAWLCGYATLPLLIAPVFSKADMTATSLAAAATALALASLLQGPGHEKPGLFPSLARRFGDVSYSMYLTHSFLLGAIAAVLAKLATGHIWWLCLLIAMACVVCTAVAWLFWHAVERPLTRFLMRKLA